MKNDIDVLIGLGFKPKRDCSEKAVQDQCVFLQ